MRFSLPTRAVTPDDVERIREQYLGGAPPSVRSEIEQRLDAVSIPSTMPYFSRLGVGPDGTIWLRAYQPFRDEPVGRWYVVAPDGAFLGAVELPPRLEVHDFGVGDVLGVWTDEYDVQYVRRYPIPR